MDWLNLPNDRLNPFLRQQFSRPRIPALRIVTADAVMRTPRKINRIPDAFTVNNRFGISR